MTERNVSQDFTQPVESVVQALRTDRKRGLSAERARELLALHGFNELAGKPPRPAWLRFIAQFQDLVIWILIAAALISGFLQEWIDALVILAIVIANGVIGFLQEERAERSLAGLRKLSAPSARVFRDGASHSVPARELVPGDLVELEAGDQVPADGRLIEAFGLQAQESALTGESVPVGKQAEIVLPPDTALGDRRNMVYMGTAVTTGKASAVIVATSMQTELGQIAGLLERQEPELTPLQRRLKEVGKVLIVVCLGIVGLIFGLQMIRGGVLEEVFLMAVSLAVAAVPEGLPAVVTIALALGVERMSKRNALIRRLPSVETLGSVTIICSDKTGTLTRNEMTVREIVVGGREYRVSGSGYMPQGEVSPADPSQQPFGAAAEADLMLALTIGARCNNAHLTPEFRVLGDPMEGALLVAALKAGIDPVGDGASVLDEIPFDSERKLMSVMVQGIPGGVVMYTKGAPESVLSCCISERIAGEVLPLQEAGRARILQSSARMGSRALRVLALAYRECRSLEECQESTLVFAGLVGMIDPPREEAREAVEKCRSAGIRPIMITGDHPATAVAIARELGIAGAADRAVTGDEVGAMTDTELSRLVGGVVVYARVSAAHKLRVVQAWKSLDQVVAMTGDGVNDAPAVKAADIGIAMGLTGTDVTREVSDMVLIDDNFASIVNAVEEGRGIFDNIQKFVHYLLACNTSEVLLMFFAALVGWPPPLLAIQILWINLVTDGLPALALAMERPEPDVMSRRPRPLREPVFSLQRGLQILMHGALLAAADIVVFWAVFPGAGASEGELALARAVTFCVAAFTQLAFSFACRSQRYTLPELGLLSNRPLLGALCLSTSLQLAIVFLPFTRSLFVEAAAQKEWPWVLIVGFSLIPVTVVEVAKLVRSWLGVRSADHETTVI